MFFPSKCGSRGDRVYRFLYIIFSSFFVCVHNFFPFASALYEHAVFFELNERVFVTCHWIAWFLVFRKTLVQSQVTGRREIRLNVALNHPRGSAPPRWGALDKLSDHKSPSLKYLSTTMFSRKKQITIPRDVRPGAEISAVSVVGKKSVKYFIPVMVGFSYSDGNVRAGKLKLKLYNYTVDLARVSVSTLAFFIRVTLSHRKISRRLFDLSLLNVLLKTRSIIKYNFHGRGLIYF